MAILPVSQMLQATDVVGNFQRGLAFGQQQREAKRQDEERQQLRNLAPSIQQGDPAAFGQAAAINPEYAAAQQGAGDDGLRRLKGAIGFIEQAQKSGNPQAVEAAYQQVRPYLARFGQQPPATFAEAEPKFMEAKARIAMLDQGGQQQRNLSVSPGSAIVDPATGQVIYERPFAPQSQSFEFDVDGRPTRFTFNTRTGNYERAELGGGQSPSLASPMGDPQGVYASLADKHGFQTTSTTRTKEENERVGGVPNSQHMTGTARDFSVRGKTPEQINAFVNDLRSQGFEVITRDHGTGPHIHAELPPSASRAAQPLVGRSREEQAGLTTAAQEAAKTAALAEQERIKADAAVDQAVRTDVGKAQAEKALAAPAAIQTLQQSLDSIDALLADPGLENIVGLGSINPLNRIPGTAARGLIARADQIAGQSFLAAFNQLKGGGAITEKEGEAATRAIARLDRSQSLEDYKTALNDLRDAISPAIERLRASQRPAATRAPAQRGPQPGQVEDGYRFRGGNPADPNNWERL